MKGKKVLKTLLAAVMSVAIAVVFVPAFGQVDKASAKTITKIELLPQEWHQLPVGATEDDLESKPCVNKEGGDILAITYDGGEATESTEYYYCKDINWNFESDDGKKVKTYFWGWTNDESSDDFAAGETHHLIVYVKEADEGTGLKKNDELENLEVKIIEAPKEVAAISLTLSTTLQLPEKENRLYNSGEVLCGEGDALDVLYEGDDNPVTYYSNSQGHFYDNGGNEIILEFEWGDDYELVPIHGDSGLMCLQGEAGKTYYAYPYVARIDYGSTTEGRIYALENGEKKLFPVTIADHTWNAPTYTWSGNNSVTAERTCAVNPSDKETETVNTTSEVTKQPTYTEKGETTYTATFTNPAFEKQTKVVDDIPMLQKTPDQQQSQVEVLAQPMVVKAAVKTVKVKKLKKKAIKVKPIKVTNPKGKVTYKIVKGKKKAKKALKLNKKTGKITVKKKTKRGTYKLKIKVTAAGTNAGSPQYKAGSKTVWVTVKVK